MAQKLVALNTMYKKASKSDHIQNSKRSRKAAELHSGEQGSITAGVETQKPTTRSPWAVVSSVVARFVIPVRTVSKPMYNEATRKELMKRAKYETRVKEAMRSTTENRFETRNQDLEKKVEEAEPAASNEASKVKSEAAAARTAEAIEGRIKEAAASEGNKWTAAEAAGAGGKNEDKDEEIRALITRKKNNQ